MLTKEDLLTCTEIPRISDISLQLYIDFAETYLLSRIFHYEFLDGSSIDLKFTEYGIYHMLSIQHIDRTIRNSDFFQKVKDGLSFRSFESVVGKKLRFKKQKKRIAMFACVYNTLTNGSMFYLPNGEVRNTANVKADYISYKKLMNISPTGITYNGINVGIRKCEDGYIPLTVLISPNSNIEEYIKAEQPKIIKRLQIIDNNNTIIEEKSFCFSM